MTTDQLFEPLTPEEREANQVIVDKVLAEAFEDREKENSLIVRESCNDG